MNESEITKRDGDCNNNCNCIGGTISKGNTELQQYCETNFKSECIVQESNSLVLYIVLAFFGGLLVAAIIFRVRRRCQLKRKKKKSENGRLVVSDLAPNTTSKGHQLFPDETDSSGRTIPTYI